VQRPAMALHRYRQRTIVAMRLDHVEVGSEVPERYRILSRAEAEAEGWFKGPPYAVAERVFDEYDMEGCSPEPELRMQHTAPTYSIPDCGSQWGSGEGLWKYTFETCILPQ
jgi:hypothetical protein